jgi:hypothetical protein
MCGVGCKSAILPLMHWRGRGHILEGSCGSTRFAVLQNTLKSNAGV